MSCLWGCWLLRAEGLGNRREPGVPWSSVVLVTNAGRTFWGCCKWACQWADYGERDFGFMAMRGQDAFTGRIGMFPSHIHVRYLTQCPRYTFFPGMSVSSCSSLIRCKTLSPLLPPATKSLDNLPMFHWEICLALGFTSNRESQLKSQIIFEDQRWTQQSRLWLNEMAKSPLRRLSVSGGNWGMGGGRTLGRLYNTNREKWLPCV